MSKRIRPSNFIDLTGTVIGRHTITSFIGGGRWECTCSCGAIMTIGAQCLRHKLANANRTSLACSSCSEGRIANQTKHPLYYVWTRMKNRCENPNSQDYPNYGGRGIRVCKSWRESFGAFVSDMGPRPAGTSIDRIDNDGNYEPGNCRWATKGVQNNNTRSNVSVTINGVRRNIAQWARVFGISRQAVFQRIKAGMDPVKALSLPVK